MANKLKIAKINTVDQQVSPILIGGNTIGGTGGDTGQTNPVISATVKVGSNAAAAGFIIAQKGAHKFRVQDASTNKGTCTLVNLPTPVTNNTMSIRMDLSTVTANVAAANVAGGATSTYVTWTGTPTGVVATPRVGDYIVGFAGAAAVAQVTAINTASNVTVAVTGNVAAQTGVSITDSTYATRITNKFIYDFNGNKYLYRYAPPTSTYVRVENA